MITLIGLVAALLAIAFVLFCSEVQFKTNIAHAGGSIKGNIYTNTAEAFSENYKKGFRVFEFDISLYDRQFVALHTIEDIEKITGKVSDRTIETLENKMKTHGYSLLFLKDVINIAKTHPDTTIIFDVKNTDGNRTAIFEEIHRLLTFYQVERERIVIQVFSPDDVVYAQKYFPRLLYVIGPIGKSKLIQLLKYLKVNNIKLVSIFQYRPKTIVILNICRTLFYQELNIIPYTVNSKKYKLFFKIQGISRFFTDSLAP